MRYMLFVGLTLLAFSIRASDTNTALTVLQDYGTRCDFGEQITRGTNSAEISTNLFALFKRLTDPGNSERGDEQRQALTELLFVEDAVLVPLREVATGTNVVNLAARTYLWFAGDKSDIAAMETKLARNPKEILLPPGLTRKDLADGLRGVRESLKLPADHFCTTGLTFNRRMTKAYVRVIVGSGAFNCVGWGLMFHLGDAGWELVWSRYEWVS